MGVAWHGDRVPTSGLNHWWWQLFFQRESRGPTDVSRTAHGRRSGGMRVPARPGALRKTTRPVARTRPSLARFSRAPVLSSRLPGRPYWVSDLLLFLADALRLLLCASEATLDVRSIGPHAAPQIFACRSEALALASSLLCRFWSAPSQCDSIQHSFRSHLDGNRLSAARR